MSTDRPTDTRWAKARSILFNAALAIAVFVAVTAYQSRNMLPADREAAPELRAATLAGPVYDLGRSHGRPALVYFFAPWCKICGASADNLERLYRWQDEGELEIVAVALDWSSAEEVSAYAERHELSMPVLLADTNLRRRWQIQAYPSYYVLDAEHRIARRDIGYSSQFGLWWRTWSVR
ncbi:MAG: TlpA disulfide reductase family protein [Woeseiaceae bacterium]|nr:TlpA disulfide reductase family protein [Woeseiaceae bacterium]